MPSYLAIDYGARRIGLAIGHSQTRVPAPLKTIEGSGDAQQDAARILRAAGNYSVDAFVVGLPLNMDGSEGPQAKIARALGDQIGKLAGRPVHFFDERLTSRAAEERMQESKLTPQRKKRRFDGVAAQIILQEFFEADSRPNRSEKSQSE